MQIPGSLLTMMNPLNEKIMKGGWKIDEKAEIQWENKWPLLFPGTQTGDVFDYRDKLRYGLYLM